VRIANLAIDSNLTLLLAVGRAERGLLYRHKRLRHYTEADYELLQGFIAVAERVVTTPHSLTEVSNLADFGILEPSRTRITASVRGLIEAFVELYCPSVELAGAPEFQRLGLADCAWLAALDNNTRLLTVDNELYLAALDRGCDAVNFNHVRVARGTL
jgi:hypothetical protein